MHSLLSHRAKRNVTINAARRDFQFNDTWDGSSISVLTGWWELQGQPWTPRLPSCKAAVMVAHTVCPVSSQVDKVDFVMISPTQLVCCRREINKLHARDGAAVWSDLPAVFSHRHLSSGVNCSIKRGGHKPLSGWCFIPAFVGKFNLSTEDRILYLD